MKLALSIIAAESLLIGTGREGHRRQQNDYPRECPGAGGAPGHLEFVACRLLPIRFAKIGMEGVESCLQHSQFCFSLLTR
jgi:hypothetical protein